MHAGTNGGKRQAFHVVAPSLPGYGFSSAPKKPGFGINQIAKTFDELMVKLGYTSYVAQGEQPISPYFRCQAMSLVAFPAHLGYS